MVLSLVDALAVEVALGAAEEGALAVVVGVCSTDAVGVGVALPMEEADGGAVRRAVTVWDTVAFRDLEVVAVVEVQSDTALERDGETEGREVPLGATVRTGDADDSKEALGDADGPPLTLPKEDAVEEGLNGDVWEGVGEGHGVVVPEKIGVGVGVDVPVEVAFPEREGPFESVAAATDGVGAAELKAHRVAVGEAHMDAVAPNEVVAKGVGEMEGVTQCVPRGDALTRGVELGAAPDCEGAALPVGGSAVLEPEGGVDALVDTDGMGVALAESEEALVGDASAAERVPAAVAVAPALVAEAAPERVGVALLMALGDSESPREGESKAVGVRWADTLGIDADTNGVAVVKVEPEAHSVTFEVRLTTVELDGQALAEVVRAPEALTRGEDETAALSDPRLLSNGEADAEVAPEGEASTVWDATALAEDEARAVSVLVALEETETASVGLSEDETEAERVTLLLAVWPRGEADAQTVALSLRKRDSVGEALAVLVSIALHVAAAPRLPLAWMEREAVLDGDAEGQPLGEGLGWGVRVSIGEAEEVRVGAARVAVSSTVGEASAGESEGGALSLAGRVPETDCVGEALPLPAALALKKFDALAELNCEGAAEKEAVAERVPRAEEEGEWGALPLGALEPLPNPFPVKVPRVEADGQEEALAEGCKELETLADAESSGEWLLLLVMEEERVVFLDGCGEAEPAPLLEVLFDAEVDGEALSCAVALRTVETEATLAADALKDAVPHTLLVARTPVSDGDDEDVPSGELLAEALKLLEDSVVPVTAELPLPQLDTEVEALDDARAVPLIDSLGDATPVRETDKEGTGEALPLSNPVAVKVGDAMGERLAEGLSEPDAIVEGDGAAELDMVPAIVEDKVTVTVAEKEPQRDREAETLLDENGDAESLGNAVMFDVLEGLRDMEGLFDEVGVAEGEPRRVLDTDDVFDEVIESSAEVEGEPSDDAVGETAADQEGALEPVMLRETGGDELAEPQGLSREEADALFADDALGAARVALPHAETLPVTIPVANDEAHPLTEPSEDAEGEAVAGLLPLADKDGKGEWDADAQPLADLEAVGEAVPHAEPLSLVVPLCIALLVPPPLVGVPRKDGVTMREALGVPETETRGLEEPAGVPEDNAEGVAVGGKLALSVLMLVARVLSDCSGAVSVAGAVAGAVVEGLCAGDGETAALDEGGGERLAEGLLEDDWDAFALGVPHRDESEEGDKEVLADGERDAAEEGEGFPVAEAEGERVAEGHALRLTGGEGVAEAQPLPRALALGLTVPQGLRAAVLLLDALRPRDREGRGDSDAEDEGHAVLVELVDGVSRDEPVGIGVAVALRSGVEDCVVVKEPNGEPDGPPDAVPQELPETVGGAFVGDAFPEAQKDAVALCDSMGEGDAAPEEEAGPVAERTPLPLAKLCVAMREGGGDADAVSEPPPPEDGVRAPLALAVALPLGEYVRGLLAQAVLLATGVAVCVPLGVPLALAVAPTEGEVGGDAVPTPLAVRAGEADGVSHTVSDGAALVLEALGVGGALTGADSEPVLVSVDVGVGVTRAVAEMGGVAVESPERVPAAEGVAPGDVLE